VKTGDEKILSLTEQIKNCEVRIESFEINKKKLEISEHEVQTRDEKILSLTQENNLNKIEIQNCGIRIKLFEEKMYNETKILIEQKTTLERD
jgi:hypothetical protein